LTELNNEQIDTISKALFKLEEYYDYILIDTQASLDSATLEFITFSDQVILIANPEITALVDLYKTIKILCSTKRGIALNIVVNKAASAESAGKIFMKIKNTVSEFGLKTFLIFLGYILFDPQRVIEAIRKRTPIILLNESGSLRQCFTLIANAFLRGAKPKRKKLFFLDLLRKS